MTLTPTLSPPLTLGSSWDRHGDALGEVFLDP
jgi:hypothetical protein